jgi:hypothetical protein
MIHVRDSNRQLQSAQMRADSAWTWVNALRDSLSRGVITSPQARVARNTLLGKSEIERLRRLGLKDPPEDLRRDLVSHPELIPYRWSHARYLFFSDETIVLPYSWVCAYFENGMVFGYVLFRYEVKQGGRIVWTRVDQQLLD